MGVDPEHARELALALPAVSEAPHWHRLAFRTPRKICATLDATARIDVQRQLSIHSPELASDLIRSQFRRQLAAFSPKKRIIPTRVKDDSFRGFQTGASQTLWRRTGGSPCGQGLPFIRTMMPPSFGP